MNAVVEHPNNGAAPVPALASAPLSVVGGPLDRIAELLLRGITPEQLNTFLDVQHKYEAEQARRAYVKAMAAFKAEPMAKIIKKKSVKQKLRNKQTGEYSGTEINYKHETLAQVVNAAVSALAKHGLSHSWDYIPEQGKSFWVSCVMTHEAGHSECVKLPGLPDETGQKNPLQQMRSTVTYLQRATLLLITGLAAEDGTDDDARGAYPQGGSNAAPQPHPAPEQSVGGLSDAKQQRLIRKRAGSDAALADVLAKVGVKTLEELPFDKVNECLTILSKAAQ